MTPNPTFLTGEWRDLVMLNYPVDPALLRPLVPAGTELDLWDGEALVSVVGFRFAATRVLGVGFPFHRDFDEVNLRFYVRRRSGDELRRAVVFIRELVPRAAIAWTARLWYNEPYRAVPMRHAITETEGGLARELRYEWRDGPEWSGLRATTRGPSSALEPGSEAEFITEHYWGYTRQRNGGTVEYQVQHPAWRVWTAGEARCSGPLANTYGDHFAGILHGTPRSAYVAEGSAISVHLPRWVERGTTRPMGDAPALPDGRP